MTHRAEQIVEAIADFHRTRIEPLGNHVYTHRRESLSHEQDETPAVSIDFGEDQPSESAYLGKIDSALTVVITFVATAPLAEDVRTTLLDLRDQCDEIMEAQMLAPDGQKLGLSFVRSVRYGGASAPDVSSEGENHTGALECSWIADYRVRG